MSGTNLTTNRPYLTLLKEALPHIAASTLFGAQALAKEISAYIDQPTAIDITWDGFECKVGGVFAGRVEELPGGIGWAVKDSSVLVTSVYPSWSAAVDALQAAVRGQS